MILRWCWLLNGDHRQRLPCFQRSFLTLRALGACFFSLSALARFCWFRARSAALCRVFLPQQRGSVKVALLHSKKVMAGNEPVYRRLAARSWSSLLKLLQDNRSQRRPMKRKIHNNGFEMNQVLLRLRSRAFGGQSFKAPRAQIGSLPWWFYVNWWCKYTERNNVFFDKKENCDDKNWPGSIRSDRGVHHHYTRGQNSRLQSQKNTKQFINKILMENIPVFYNVNLVVNVDKSKATFGQLRT